jgi:hypothetical protein
MRSSARAQAAAMAGQGYRGKTGQQTDQVSAAYAVDVELGPEQCAQQVLFGALAKVHSLDRTVHLTRLLGLAIQSANAGAVILDRAGAAARRGGRGAKRGVPPAPEIDAPATQCRLHCLR